MQSECLYFYGVKVIVSVRQVSYAAPCGLVALNDCAPPHKPAQVPPCRMAASAHQLARDLQLEHRTTGVRLISVGYQKPMLITHE